MPVKQSLGLSPRQQDVLVAMLDEPLDEHGYQGINQICTFTTLEALRQKDLVRYFPHGTAMSYGLTIKGIWKLTKAGRKVAKALDNGETV